MTDTLAIGHYSKTDAAALRADLNALMLDGLEAIDGVRAEQRAGIRALAYIGHKPLDGAVMDKLPGLQVIANFGVGYDAINVAHATARGIRVTNTPDVLNDDVADLAVGMLIAQTRDFETCARAVRTGDWAKNGALPLGRKMSGRKIGMLGMDSWNEIGTPPDLSEIFETPDYAAWNSLRDSQDSRYLALTLPRVLSREPYGQNTNSVVEEFDFQEETDGHDGKQYAWMNAAHAMAVNINRAHKEYGWTVQIRGVQSGGEVMNLPSHTFDTGEGSKDLKCPSEVSITDRRDGELSKAGLICLIHRKHTDKAAFIGAQTLYRPKKYVDDLATASDNMSSRLPYIFAVSRFSHYLKVMVRDKIGQNPDRLQLQTQLQSWVNKYVSGNPESASEREKAKKPLAGAKVEVVEDEENPGYYVGKFFLKPHFQLEGMDIGMSLVSKLPKGK